MQRASTTHVAELCPLHTEPAGIATAVSIRNFDCHAADIAMLAGGALLLSKRDSNCPPFTATATMQLALTTSQPKHHRNLVSESHIQHHNAATAYRHTDAAFIPH
jgi:hypothetical protein